eukprot:7538381-Alexandrium_andersonii.AAC.1
MPQPHPGASAAQPHGGGATPHSGLHKGPARPHGTVPGPSGVRRPGGRGANGESNSNVRTSRSRPASFRATCDARGGRGRWAARM